MPAECAVCQKEIEFDEAYHHQSKMLCEDCCLDARSSRSRKTHWQYIKSIKTEYLIK